MASHATSAADIELTSVSGVKPACTSASETSRSVAEPRLSALGHPKTVRWYQAVFLLMTDVFGTGVLGLPHAAANVGWALAYVLLILFSIFTVFAGLLLVRVKGLYPEATCYADVMRAQVGPKSAMATQCLIVFSWIVLLPVYLIPASDFLSHLIDGASDGGEADSKTLCFWGFSLICVGLLIAPAQVRSLEKFAFLSTPSFVAMLFVILLVSIDFAKRGETFGDLSSTGPPPGVEFLQFYGSASAYIFAYQGHSRFLEIADDMANPSRDFPKALLIAYPLMTFFYGLTILVGYGILGSSIDPSVLSSMETDGLARACGALLAFHVLVSYVFVANLAIKKLHPVEHLSPPSKRAVHWLACSLIGLAFAYVFANAIPFMGALQELIGAATGAPIIFGFPAFFYLNGMRLHRRLGEVSTLEKAVCGVLFLIILLPMLTVVGIVAAFKDLIEEIKDSGAPFGCD